MVSPADSRFLEGLQHQPSFISGVGRRTSGGCLQTEVSTEIKRVTGPHGIAEREVGLFRTRRTNAFMVDRGQTKTKT